jgi:hypothetical protein
MSGRLAPSQPPWKIIVRVEDYQKNVDRVTFVGLYLVLPEEEDD